MIRQYPPLFLLLTLCLFSSSSFANAKSVDEKSVDASNALLVKAKVFIKSGQTDKALVSYQALISEYPESISAVLSMEEYLQLRRHVNMFGIKKDSVRYPQSTPQELLHSIRKAIQADDIEYIAAHMIGHDDYTIAPLGRKDRFNDIVEEFRSPRLQPFFMKTVGSITKGLETESTFEATERRGLKIERIRVDGHRIDVYKSPLNIYQWMI